MRKPFERALVPEHFYARRLDAIEAYLATLDQPVQPTKGDGVRRYPNAGLKEPVREYENTVAALVRDTFAPAKGDAPATEADARELLARIVGATCGPSWADAIMDRTSLAWEPALAVLTEALRRPARVVEDGEVRKIALRFLEVMGSPDADHTAESIRNGYRNDLLAALKASLDGMAIMRIETKDQP